MELKDKILSGVKILECKFFKKREPLIVNFEVTSRCNADCKYCKYKGKKEEFSTEEAVSIISDLSDLGTKKMIFTGGEPLIRDDIGLLISEAKQEGMSVNLNSNGFLVPERVDTVKKTDKLVLSLDGPEEIHNELRGKESFQKVMKAIRVAKSNNIPVFITSVISKLNIDKIDWLLNKKLKNAKLLKRLLDDEIRTLEDRNNTKPTYYFLVVLTKEKEQLKDELLKQGIDTGERLMRYCPKRFGKSNDSYPNTKKALEESLQIPIYPPLGKSVLKRIAKVINDYSC